MLNNETKPPMYQCACGRSLTLERVQAIDPDTPGRVVIAFTCPCTPGVDIHLSYVCWVSVLARLIGTVVSIPWRNRIAWTDDIDDDLMRRWRFEVDSLEDSDEMLDWFRLVPPGYLEK